MLFLRQVSGQQQALTACGLNPARGFLRVFMLIQISDGDVGAFTGIGNRHCPPDAAVCSGDECNLAFEAIVAGIRLLTTIRVGLHLAL